MRTSRNPDRRNRGWILLSVVGAAASVCALTAVALAGPKQAPPTAQAAVAPSAYKQRIAAQLSEFDRVRARVKKFAVAAARERTRTQEATFVFGGAADGQQLYWVRLKLRFDFKGDDFPASLKVALMRTDRATGVDQKLLEKKDIYPISLHARGGRVAFQTIGSAGAAVGESYKSVIYAGATSESTIPVVDIAKLDISDDEENVCSDFRSLNGVSSSGDAIITAVQAECRHGQSAELSATRWLWKPDGARQEIGVAAAGDIFGSGTARAAGGKLVGADPYVTATAITDIDSGERSSLWSPRSGSFDVANDGSVALVGNPPLTGIRDRKDKPKSPFVIFPGGDVDSPKVIAGSLAKAEAVQFCGPNLYTVVGSLSFAQILAELSGEESLFFPLLPNFFPGEHRIKLYDAQGNFVKELAKISQKGLSSVGCNGDRLVVGVIQGKTVRGTEVGP